MCLGVFAEIDYCQLDYLKFAKQIYWMKSITLYLILGSRSNSDEVRGSLIVMGGAHLWRIDRGEMGRNGKS